MNKQFARLCGVLAIALFSQVSMAAPITAGSQISTGGTLEVIGGDGSVSNATGLNFTNPGDPASLDPRGVLSGYIGNDALSNFGCPPTSPTACGFIEDIQSFAAFQGIHFFLDAMNFTFDLSAPLDITRVPGSPNSAAALILSGNGTINANGFDATNGLFTLVTLNNNSGATTYSATVYSLGTDSVPLPVPEPGSILLIGMGFAGLLAARRKSA